MGIPRTDAGAEGIHLAWSGPKLIGMSLHGYDVQRRELIGQDWEFLEPCTTIGRIEINTLREFHQLTTPQGLLQYSISPQFIRIDDPLLHPLSADGATHETTLPVGGEEFASNLVEVFIQHFLRPTPHIDIWAEVSQVFAVALSEGKVLSTAYDSSNTSLQLTGQAIDTVVVYAIDPQQIRICVAPPVATTPSDTDSWAQIPYIANGLTLPIIEADSSLATADDEISAFLSRLIDTDLIVADDLGKLAPSLRLAAQRTDLGRPSDRILVVRPGSDQPFHEISFESELALLQLHPTWRRALGFGYADRDPTLNPGTIYEYRITGYFRSEDLADAIYDVNAVPSGTTLPVCVHIRELNLRFPRTVTVVLHPPVSDFESIGVSRRGIAISEVGFDSSWLLPDLGQWSAVLDFARPVDRVILEVAEGHSFEFAAGDPSGFGSVTPAPVPIGPSAELVFTPAASQLRLRGDGILYAVRVPAGPIGEVALCVETGPVPFEELTAPPPPLLLSAANAQSPPTILTGDIGESTDVPPRPYPGFELTWLPSHQNGLGYWPPNLEPAPPIDDIAFQIEHSELLDDGTPGSWDPLHGADNLTLGSRNDADPEERLAYGADLDQLFSERPPNAGGARFVLRLRDVFDIPDPRSGTARPSPETGSIHQYRIRAMDVVGRVSDEWTLSNRARLEKRFPPPQPVGPQPPPLLETIPSGDSILAGTPGLRARALVAGDPNLSAEDLEKLGAHENAVVLEWGWRDLERALDPKAREFRVYQSPNPPDEVPGTVVAVNQTAEGWLLDFEADRPLEVNECAGQWVSTGGYRYQITSHVGGTAGSTIPILLRKAEKTSAPAPEAGALLLTRPLRPHHLRPTFWTPRVGVVPLTSDDSYEFVFHDVLTLDLEHLTDRTWVGVSAADGESYVPDELPSDSPNGGRVGNESSIAVGIVTARFAGRPDFVPPPLGPVAEQVTEESTGREILVTLDLPSLLEGALPPGSPIALDRCDVDSFFEILRLDAGVPTLLMRDGTLQAIPMDNPDDAAEVATILDSNHPESLANRYVLFLVANHQRPDEIFDRVSGQVDAFAKVADRLPSKPGRYIYRVRKAVASGRVSVAGAIVSQIVRVPSTVPPAAPARLSLSAVNNSVNLEVRVPGDPELTHLLLFAMATANPALIPEPSSAELLRLPNRPDLYPFGGIRLRVADGMVLAPLVVKDLNDADIAVESDGHRAATLTVPTPPDSWVWVQCWCYSISRDGIPSAPAGPFGIGSRSLSEA